MNENKTNSTAQRADGFWNVFGSLVYSGCQWGILVATVKLCTAADAGRISLGFAISAPIFLLLQMRLRAASATDVKGDFAAGDYMSLRLGCTALALVGTLLACLASGLTRAESQVVMLVAAAKAIECGSDLMYGLLQRADKMRAVAISLMLRGVLAGGLFAAALIETHSLDAALAVLCGSWLLVFLGFDLPRAAAASEERWSLQTSVARLKQLGMLTVPLGLSTMFMSLMANMPRYFVQHWLGLGVLGIFSAAGYLTMTVSIVISALAEAGIARMARMFAGDGKREAARLLQRIALTTLALSALSIVVSAMFGEAILKAVYRPEYGSAAQLLTGLLVAGTLANLASVYGYALLAARSFIGYLACLAASCGVTAVACALLVPRWGLRGAVGACLLGYGVQALSSWWALRGEFAAGDAEHVVAGGTPTLGY